MTIPKTGSAELESLLRFDPLDTAEKMLDTRGSGAIELGMMMAMSHGATKKAILEANDDTTFSNGVDRYVRIVKDLGFEQVLDLPFTGREPCAAGAPQEHFYIFAHRDGMILCFDTYNSKDVNGGHLYYNIEFDGVDHANRCWATSSGSWVNYEVDNERRIVSGVWAGHHDAREGLRHVIANIRKAGKLLPKWQENPFLWLLHYMDTKTEGYDYDAINAERLAMVPAWVRNILADKEG